MWIAVGIDTKTIYMMSDTKSSVFLKLQQKYKSNMNLQHKSTYPEPLMVQRRL